MTKPRPPTSGDVATQAPVPPALAENFGITIALDMESLKALVAGNMDDARDLSLSLLSGLKTGSLIVVSILVNLALIPVVMFYLLRDWDMIAGRLFMLVPRHWLPKTRAVAGDIDRVLAEFLRGQIMVMVVLAVYYAIALTIAGLDKDISIGVLTGLLVFIPYVGFGLGLTLGVLAALLQWTGWPGFTAVLAFGQLFGFAGVPLALPASAALLVGLRHLRMAYFASPVYGETERAS